MIYVNKDTMAPLHLCYAAAGAGKTQALVRSYLRHALANPSHANKILAVTFTNAATQEMKSRILGTLHQLAQGKEAPISDTLRADFHCDTNALQKKAQRLLSYILHHYDQFAITTIDGLFQKIVRTFTSELALPPAYSITLNQSTLLKSAITQFWGTLSDYPALEEALTTFSLYKVNQGKTWDCTSDLSALGHVIAQGIAIPALQQLTSLAELQTFFASRAQEATHFQVTLSHFAQEALNAIATNHFSPSDFAWGRRGVVGFLEKVAAKQPVSPSARIRKAATEPNSWRSKTNAQNQSLAHLVETALQPLLHKLITFYDQHHTHFATTRALQSLYYALASTTRLQAILAAHHNLAQTIPMVQLPLLLRKILAESSIPFLYEKIGTSYQHFLIDEFQDVSNTQWALLRPLVAHGMMQKGSGFLVGDVKQAIYRWRGGDAQLFLSKVAQEIGQQGIQKTVLPYNWRSGKHIINFNNALFITAAATVTQILQTALQAQVPASPEKERLLAQIAQIKHTYAHTAQALPPQKPGDETGYTGYVELAFFLKKKEDTEDYRWQETALARTIQQVETLQQRYSLGQIAILVRNHKEINMVVEGFAQYKKSPAANPALRYETATNGGTPLAKNPYVELLIHALHYLHSPQEGWLLATLVHLHQTYGKPKNLQPLASQTHAYWQAGKTAAAAEAYLPKKFLKQVFTATHLPLPSLVEKLIRWFAITNATARPYIHAFQEIIHSFTAQGGHLASFLCWWEEEGKHHTLPMPPTEDQVTVMTIHQSKGLAFDAILIPFCTWSLDHSPLHPPILWCHTSAPPFELLPCAPLYYQKKLLETHFSPDYYQEQWQTYLDNINLLYVACTRTREYLFLFAPTVNEKITTIGDLLQKTFQEHPQDWHGTKEGDIHIFSLGKKRLQPSSKSKSRPPVVPQHIIPSGENHGQKIFKLLTPHLKTQGKWWHALLAQVEKKEEIKACVMQYVHTGRVTRTEANHILAEIDSWCSNDLFADWFSGEWEVKREERILFSTGSALRPDRVMIKGKLAIVLDFKTGMPKAKHTAQVQQYAQALTQLGYQPVKGYLFYTGSNRLVSVL